MENLPTLFAALDTVLSLHYSSSTTVPTLHGLCAKATRLTNKRVTSETVELILGYYPQAYRVLLVGTENYDYGLAAPEGISPTKFGSLLAKRRVAFEERVKASKEPSPIKLSSVAVPENTQTTSPKKSPTKIQKSPTKFDKKAREGLSNKSSRFTLKEKNPNTGLSLLERIRLKEQARLGTDPKAAQAEKHNAYIKSKTPAVYDILYELVSAQEAGPFQSFSISKVVSIIQDSLDTGLGDKEIQEAVEAVAAALPNKIQLLKYKDISAVKIFPLDRDADLQALKSPINKDSSINPFIT